MVKISNIKAREILDSRGFPTVEVDLSLSDGSIGRASVPSGASTGILEAVELRDGDKARYNGKGVLKAIENVNNIIAPKLIGNSPFNQTHIDEILINLDECENKSNLGANAILAVSLANAKASAISKNIALYQYIERDHSQYKLPKTYMNIINGGAHANNGIDIQEFMIIPNIDNSAKESIRMGAEIFHSLKSLLNAKGLATSVGDEGGFAPALSKTEEALDFIMEAISSAGYKPGIDVNLALDCAASEFYVNEKYQIEGNILDKNQMIDFYRNLTKFYPIISIEDPMAENDYEGWKALTKELGKDIMLVGDDLFVTNSKILKMGIDDGFANSILIKLNQIGTLSETLKTINLAKENNYKAIISHRSGETEDTTISHLVVATGVGFIKTGSLCRTDRMAKYNELIRIEEDLFKLRKHN